MIMIIIIIYYYYLSYSETAQLCIFGSVMSFLVCFFADFASFSGNRLDVFKLFWSGTRASLK